MCKVRKKKYSKTEDLNSVVEPQLSALVGTWVKLIVCIIESPDNWKCEYQWDNNVDIGNKENKILL